ncbi:MAG: spore coat protein CotH, partial [Hamadaea sp.]|nr:spore coat protein CotH [Hamadaea sp.]
MRVRHYWKLLAVCGLSLVALVVLAGNVEIRPIVTSGGAGKSDDVVENVAGTVDLFDATIAHTITLSYGEAEYQRMMDEFIATGEKEYLRADLTIDGTVVEDVGIRLKGNSTLSGLTHKGKT